MKHAAAALLLALAFPLVGPRDMVVAVYFTLLYITLALNYDLLGGHLGFMNLGQGVFFGTAAYATMILVKSGILAGLGLAEVPVVAVAAVFLVGVLALLSAYLLFRLHGAYFAMATFALVVLVKQVIENLPDHTGGFNGIYISSSYFIDLWTAYYLMLTVLVCSMGLNVAVARGRLGLAVAAIRDSETAASAVGIRVFRVKQCVLVLSAIPSACAGVIFALQAGYIDVASALGHDKTLFPVIMAMMGGTGFLAGPILGGVLIRTIDVVVKNVLHLAFPAMAVYGIILLGIGLLMPQGILGRFKRSALRHPPRTRQKNDG